MNKVMYIPLRIARKLWLGLYLTIIDRGTTTINTFLLKSITIGLNKKEFVILLQIEFRNLKISFNTTKRFRNMKK